MPGNSETRKVDDYLFVSVADTSKLLYPGDFVDGQIVLRCVSQMEGYQDVFTQVRLGPKLSKNGDPVPERGKTLMETLKNGIPFKLKGFLIKRKQKEKQNSGYGSARLFR